MARERGAPKRPGAGLSLGERGRRRLVPVAWRRLGEGRRRAFGGLPISRCDRRPGIGDGRRGVDVEFGTATARTSRSIGVHGERGGGRDGVSWGSERVFKSFPASIRRGRQTQAPVQVDGPGQGLGWGIAKLPQAQVRMQAQAQAQANGDGARVV